MQLNSYITSGAAAHLEGTIIKGKGEGTMQRDYTIGTAIRMRRQALNWSLQRLIDASHIEMSTGHLATIETKDVAPSVYVADALAKGLGTTIDVLLREAADPVGFSAPSEHAQRVPVIPWNIATEWARNPDPRRLPAGTVWVMPPETPPGKIFAMTVRDESMQAPSGISFTPGYTIFVDPGRKGGANDFVVGHLGDPASPVFKKLTLDGSAYYLRALNPQFPMQQVGDTFEVIGVVVGLCAAIDKGGVL
jgi:SOS-response transcriptional repressor LexA